MKTCVLINLSERDLRGERVLWICLHDTTSEPPIGNDWTGAPVKASMSDGNAVTRVEPWNVYHPTPDLQGVGIFYAFPETDIGYMIQDMR